MPQRTLMAKKPWYDWAFSGMQLFPLNRSRGFIRNIEHYAVNVGRFGNNSVADCAEQVIGELCKLDRHCIGRSYRANADCVVIGALIAHNTD